MTDTSLEKTNVQPAMSLWGPIAMLYSALSYLCGVAALVYLILFIGDILVPITINSASAVSPKLNGFTAILWDCGLVVLWGLQHSVMARPSFKRIWIRFVPAAVERSTYLVSVALATALLILFWVPMPSIIWNFSGSWIALLLTTLYFFGWLIVLLSTFLINHFQLFGLQQAFFFLKNIPSKREIFKTPFLYKLVRHPMMSGVLISLWSVPTLTTGRLVFNLLMSAYIFIGLYFEEITLTEELGEDYLEYKKHTPSVVPRLEFSKKPKQST